MLPSLPAFRPQAYLAHCEETPWQSNRHVQPPAVLGVGAYAFSNRVPNEYCASVEKCFPSITTPFRSHISSPNSRSFAFHLAPFQSDLAFDGI